MAYIAATLNPEILKNFLGPVRVGKKKSGSGRVAGTRQGLILTKDWSSTPDGPNVTRAYCFSTFPILTSWLILDKKRKFQ